MVRPALLILTVLFLLAGCGGGPAEEEQSAFPCDRGFRAADWKQQAAVTARSIEKCRWLNGKTRRQVKALLGDPSETLPNALSYALGGDGRGHDYLNITLTDQRVSDVIVTSGE